MGVAAPASRHFSPDDAHRVISTAFDPRFYRAIYRDVPAEVGALWHYRMQGWREGRDPAPWFSAEGYLDDYPDVREAGLEPFFHFLSIGRHEGRDVAPSRHVSVYFSQPGWAPRPWTFEAADNEAGGRAGRRDDAPPPIPWEDQKAAIASDFDLAFYAAMNPDVVESQIDPLDHFVVTGWREGRDPHPRFSVRDYLELHPDVAASGLNPFAHYVIAGRAEGRATAHELGFRYDIIAHLKPVGARIEAAAAASRAVGLSPSERLILSLAGSTDLHITFSHDDYTRSSGGLQACLQRESARFAALGVDHLHLHPEVPWPSVRSTGEPAPLGVLLNGRRVGVYAPETIREVLTGVSAGRRSFAIHSLLGHNAEDTADILEAAGLTEGVFWLHDFASLCVGYHLLRNDVEDCAAPAPDSAACRICAYGAHRARHLESHRRLFDRLTLTVAAPSQTTLDFWRSRGGAGEVRAVILPHARLKMRERASATLATRPFRLAFLGMPTPLKGWPIFRHLAERFRDDPRYEFLHLGGRADLAAPVRFQRVVATPDEPRAMQLALEEAQVDAALIWPLCRETFSFTAYEAVAAGVAVITGPDSGNVAAFVSETGGGLILAEADLAPAFASGRVLALRTRRAAVLYDLEYSGMTAELLAGPAA